MVCVGVVEAAGSNPVTQTNTDTVIDTIQSRYLYFPPTIIVVDWFNGFVASKFSMIFPVGRMCLHNITQSMSRKGNCMDNGAMENYFGRLKVEMFYGEKFESLEAFIHELNEYIYYYNNERISSKLKMSPVQYRTHFHII